MDVRKDSIYRFISAGEATFVIPVYQRNYDWKRDNCLQLFNDVINLTATHKTHFIGTICYKSHGRNDFVIIDGQQRLTSIMLMMKAIYDICDDEKLRKKINDRYLINDYSKYSDGGKKLKLKPIKKDESVFDKLMGTEKAYLSEIFSVEEKVTNIFKNYELFIELTQKEVARGKSLDEIEDAVEGLEIVEICLTDENPQVIFESLNSTGLGLTNTDLLRNYLLMSLAYKDQEVLYQNYWMRIEELIKSENMEQFLVDYLILKRKSNDLTENGKKAKITSKNLYYAFRKQFRQIDGNAKDQVESLFIDMRKYAEIYKHFLYDESTVYQNLSPVDKKLYELFYNLGSKNASILILFIYEKMDKGELSEEIFIELLDICISFAFRSKVCNWSGFSAQFSALTVQKLDVPTEDFKILFWKAITSGRGRYAFPSDRNFIDALVYGNVYQSLRSAGSKYLLYTLEKNLPHSKELPPYSSGSVEHILPRTPNDEWNKYLKERGDSENYEKYTQTLGNLTLTNYNSELSNNFFESKKEEYAKSNYAYTNELSDITSWISTDIEARGKRMADAAVKIWKLDNEYTATTIDTGETYTLFSDLPSFLGQKPATVSVLGEEKQIKSWVDFLKFATDKFYEEDPKIFLELLSYDNFPGKKAVISRTNEGMKKSYEVGKDNLFINTNYDTVDLLRIIKCIAEYYDKATDSSWSEDIWFTIRRN